MKIANQLSSLALIGLSMVAWLPQLAAQSFTVNPTSITLNSGASSTTSVTQALTISVTGGGGQTLTVSTAGGSWLRVIVSSVTGCTTEVIGCNISNPGSAVNVTVQANPTGLAQGTYNGTVNVTLTNSSTPSTQVPVTFTVGTGVGGGTSILSASPSSLTFTSLPGQNAPSQSVGITNTGSSTTYTASSNVSWLSTSLGSNQGFSPGTLTVNASAAALAVGSYTGTITLAPAGGGQATVINVTYIVSTTQQLQVTPSALSFSYISGSGASNPNGNLSIGVTTGSPVAYTATISYGSGTTGWLTTSPSGGGTTGTASLPTTMLVTATASSLPVGTYTASIAFAGSGLTTVTVPVTLVVSSPPTLTATPSPLTINVQPSSVNSASLTVGTSTGASVNYSITSAYVSPASPAVNWLTVAPSTGATPATVTVGVNPGSLPVGTYTATLTINSSTVGVTPTTVNVTMNVTNSQIVTFSPTSLSFNYVGGGSIPGSQNIQLGLSPASPAQQATVTAVPDVAGQTWLSASLVSPSSPFITGSTYAQVSVNPSGLANGTYTGKVQINIFGAVTNPTILVPVTMVVSGVTGGGSGGTATVVLSQSQFNFHALPLGGTAPDQILTLSSSNSTALSYTVTSNTSWLTVLNGSGTTTGAVTLRVNTSGLAAGTYSGQVILSASGASNNGLGIPVTLTLNSTNQLQTTPSGFTFNYVGQSGAFPQAQTLQVSSTTGVSLPVSATFTTQTGGAWLSVSPTSVNTLNNFVVSVNSSVLQSLAVGTYTGNIALTATGAANPTVNIPVVLNITGTTGGGGGTTNDQLVVGPSPMIFFSNTSASTQAQTFDINTLSGNGISYTLSSATQSGGSWLSLSTLSGTSPAQVTATVNTTGLAAGTYSGTITVTSPSATNSGLQIPVNLTISSATNLVTSPSGVTFVTPVGSTSLMQKFITLSTTSGQQLPITVTTQSNSGQLTVSTNSTTTPATVTVSLNPSGFAAGVYSGVVQVTSNGAGNAPLNLPVSLIVTSGSLGGGATTLTASPNTLSFTAQPFGTAPAQRTVTISSNNGSATSFSVTSNTSWLLAGPSSGTTPGSITVGVLPSSLSAGSYSGQVTVTGGGTTITIPVTLEVTNNPSLQVSQQSVTFNYQTGQTLPTPRPILVTTSNGSSVISSVTTNTASGGNWLLAAPTSLSTPGAFAVSLANGVVSTLAAGTYTGTVTVTASGTANSTAVINVTLNVSASALITMSTSPAVFNAQFGGSTPPSQTRQITATSGSLNVSVTTSTLTNSGWLSANINTNVTPATLTISASPFGLGTGVYTGSVSVTGGNSATPLVIPVTLNVSSQPLISVDKSELVFGSGGTSSTQPQTLQISSSSTNFSYSVQANVTNSPTNWLAVNAVSGVTPSALTVSVNPALLSDGTYFGTVVITGSGVGNSPMVIPVTLTVNQSTALSVNPTALSFTQIQGAAVASAQSVQVTSQLPTTFNVTSAVQSPVGGNWLNVTQSGGLTNGFIQVGLNNTASSLPAGVYTATVTVFGPNSPNNVPITVTLTVVPSATLVAAPTSLSFAGNVGTTNPSSQTVALSSSSATTPVPYTASSDSPWLTVSPATGTTPGSLTVNVNVSGLATGTYTGRITLVPSGVVGGTNVVIPVTLKVDPSVTPVVRSFANAATFIQGALAPGMIISIFGENLGPASPTSGVSGQVVSGKFTTSLSGTRVLFDGIAAPILFTSAGQVNAVVPYAMAGRASARMTVEYNSVTSVAIEPRINETAPGIFQVPNSSQAAMFNQNGTYNSSSNPADRGTVAVIYVTGEGATNPAGVDGEVIGTNLKKPLGTVRVRVGGVEVPAADIFYAGSAPQLVSGLMQINFRVPSTAPVGAAVSLEVFVGSGSSQPSVTMAIR